MREITEIDQINNLKFRAKQKFHNIIDYVVLPTNIIDRLIFRILVKFENSEKRFEARYIEHPNNEPTINTLKYICEFGTPVSDMDMKKYF